MILTASDASSLARSLSRWEVAEYFACALVALGCAGEYVSEFTNWLTAGDEEREKRLAKRSTLLLIASLALELVCLVRTNSLSGQLIGSLSDKASSADAKAESALDKSVIAENKATGADIRSGKAQEKADAVGKKADDLLTKYENAERELIELKAKSLPRRLSSQQTELLRKRVVAFTQRTIFISCVNGGRETFDFEQDFIAAFRGHLIMEYEHECSEFVGPLYPPPIQIEAGDERQGDATILLKALLEIGISKKDIVTKPNQNKLLLALTVGPKAP